MAKDTTLKKYLETKKQEIFDKIYEDTLSPEEEKIERAKYDLLNEVIRICENRKRY